MQGLVRELVAAVRGGEVRCVLVAGPAACGKSLAAGRVARECGLPFVVLDCSLLAACTDAREADAALLRALLPLAQTGGVLLLDSLDAILPAVAGAGGARGRQAAAAVQERLEELAVGAQVVLLATAPGTESLAPAAAALFASCVRRVGPPRDSEREAMVAQLLGRPAPATAAALRGCSGGEVRRALLAAMQESDEPSDARVAAEAAGRRPAALAALEGLSGEGPCGWAAVAGLARERALLEAAVLRPLREGGEPPLAALLTGPSGAGKTWLAAAAAAESSLPALVVRGPDVLSAVVGAAEKRVAELFARARAGAPCVVLLDQLDSLAPAAGGGEEDLTQTQGRVAAALAAELDVCPAARVAVLATAARPGAVDAAVLRRFELRLALPPPSREHAALVLRHGLGRLRSRLSPEQLAAAAERCATLSAAACAAVCAEAALGCLRRCIAAGRETDEEALVVEAEDIMAAASLFV